MPDATEPRWGVLFLDGGAVLATALDQLAACDFVLVVRDAGAELAWPGVARLCAEAEATGAAARGEPVTDTVKLADENGFVTATPERARLRRLLTPQAFRLAWLEYALRSANTDVDDPALAVVAVGYRVTIVTGE